MQNTTSIVSVGEVLIDFVSTAIGPLKDSPGFVKAVGGEAANVAVGLAKLGSRSAFIGKVGADSFGRFLVESLKKSGVDCGGVLFDRKHKTRLAFVSLTQSGERDFEFWEKFPAGERLQLFNVNLQAIRKFRIVNIAPLLLLHEPSRSTAFRLAKRVRKRGGMTAFDANVRLALWRSAADAKRVLLQMVRATVILRLNEQEARFLSGRGDVRSAARKLRSFGPTLVAITLGAKGSYFQTRNADGFVPGHRVKAVDTTGCGDAFFAALLHGLAQSRLPIGEMSNNELHSICTYANAVGALTSLKRGGAEGVPYLKDVAKFMKKNSQ